VDWLKECTPDLLITRTYVQNLPGHEAAMYLRTKCPAMMVLMLGGVSMTIGFTIGRRSTDLKSFQSHIAWLRCSKR